MRYDWDRYGHSWAARVNRIGMWWLTVCALLACPLFLLDAVTRDWTLAFPALLIGGGAVLQQVAVRKVYGVRKAPEPAARQVLRESIVLPPPVPAPRPAWDVSMTLSPAVAWNDVCHYEDASRKPDGIAHGVIRVIPRTAVRPWSLGAAVVTSWEVVTRAPSHGEGIDLLKAAEPLLRERLAEAADPRARYFTVRGGALAEVLGCVAPPETRALAVPAGTSMAGFATGTAHLTAALGSCAHPDAEPVDLLVTGERVAWLCPDCPAELPAGWR